MIRTGNGSGKTAGSRKGIPSSVLVFIGKGLLLFIIWKLLYLSWLQPKRILDDPLTTSVGVATTAGLNLFSGGDTYTVLKVPDTASADVGGAVTRVMEIYLNKGETLKIADPCNGLELMVLYAGFLLCFPGVPRRKAVFILFGWILIVVMNILRCMLLVLIFVHWRKYLDFSHHFVFTFIVYLVIFGLWYRFTKKQVWQPAVSQNLTNDIVAPVPSERVILKK